MASLSKRFMILAVAALTLVAGKVQAGVCPPDCHDDASCLSEIAEIRSQAARLADPNLKQTERVLITKKLQDQRNSLNNYNVCNGLTGESYFGQGRAVRIQGVSFAITDECVARLQEIRALNVQVEGLRFRDHREINQTALNELDATIAAKQKALRESNACHELTGKTN